MNANLNMITHDQINSGHQFIVIINYNLSLFSVKISMQSKIIPIWLHSYLSYMNLYVQDCIKILENNKKTSFIIDY